eukprot:9326916-Pyramimonas_sp.AAC.1
MGAGAARARAREFSRTVITLGQAGSARLRFVAGAPVIPLESRNRRTCAWQSCRPKLPWTPCHPR